MEILLSLGLKFLPYILGVLAVVGAYLGIKRKGVTEERNRQAQASQVAQAKVEAAVKIAASADEGIDQRVEAKVNAAKVKLDETQQTPTGDTFRFKF